MSDLTQFRDHCRRMASPGSHHPACRSQGRLLGHVGLGQLAVQCVGCVSDDDRLVRQPRPQHAVDDYLVDDPTLFEEDA